MTTANKITLVRIAMIPFFVVFALMYVLFYKITSRSYLGIVSGNGK